MPKRTSNTQVAKATKPLREIPSIGPSLALDLWDLGIRRVADLKGRNPEKLYQQLIQLRGAHQDRCVLYTFRCAVYFATERNPEPERLKWWNWQDAKMGKVAKSAKARVSRRKRS
jgi:hypothetical protein